MKNFRLNLDKTDQNVTISLGFVFYLLDFHGITYYGSSTYCTGFLRVLERSSVYIQK